jgi:chemotaxis methyl-accepting protein methylase
MRDEDKTALTPMVDALLHARLGYVIVPWPAPLWERLGALAKAAQMSPQQLLSHIRATQTATDSALLDSLVDAATVTHTSFFRHPAHFERLERELKERAGKQLELLCVGCSRGEEVYSLALTAGRAGARARIHAVDVNAAVLAHARLGHYDARSTRGLPGADPVHGWTAPLSLREQIRFERCSIEELLKRHDRRYDFIFCRNVLIYFRAQGAHEVLQALARKLTRTGALIVAPTESLGLLPPELERSTPSGWLVRTDRSQWLQRGPARTSSLKVGTAVAQTASLASLSTIAQPLPGPAPLHTLELTLDGASDEGTLQEWLEAHPDDPIAWLLFGELLARRGQAAQACVAFEQAKAHAAQSSMVDRELLSAAATRRIQAIRGPLG